MHRWCFGDERENADDRPQTVTRAQSVDQNVGVYRRSKGARMAFLVTHGGVGCL